MSILASACAKGCKCTRSEEVLGGGKGTAKQQCWRRVAHPVAKSVDAVRVIVQPLGGCLCVRGDLIFTIIVGEQELKAGLGGCDFLEAARGGVIEGVVA